MINPGDGNEDQIGSHHSGVYKLAMHDDSIISSSSGGRIKVCRGYRDESIVLEKK